MDNKSKKVTTLDELANMVAQGFENIDLKLEGLATREELFALEKRLEKN